MSVSAVTWEGDIASTGAVGVAGSGIRPAATVGLEVGADVSGGGLLSNPAQSSVDAYSYSALVNRFYSVMLLTQSLS